MQRVTQHISEANMPDVTTSLCYLARVPSYISEKPYKIVAGADETYEQDLTNIVAYWHHNIRIEDIRAQKSELKLEQHGFEVLSHTSQYPVLDDVAACTAYKEEASAMLREHLKAEKVICFDFRVQCHDSYVVEIPHSSSTGSIRHSKKGSSSIIMILPSQKALR